ncbi:bactofilin family protein [Haladaptatus sp. NG-WS-4]
MASSYSKAKVALLVLILVISTIPGVVAAETRASGTIVVEEGETVRDLEAFGGTVIVRGTVDGNLQAFGGSVIVDGEVTGNVEVFAGSVRISGTVGGDVETAGGSVVVTRDAVIDGNLAAGAEDIVLDGTVVGDATIGAETISLGPTASVGGDLTYDGALSRAPGAAVAGAITRDNDLSIGPAVPVVGDVDTSIPGWILDVYFLVMGLVGTAILLVVFPEFSNRVTTEVLESPLRSGGVGFLSVIGVPIALVLVALTIVGIPLTIIGAFLFAFAALVGAAYGRVAVGTWLTSYADVENRWTSLVVGFVVVAIVAQIPYLGGLVEAVVSLLGLGALATLLYENYRGTPPETVDEPADESGVRPA